MKKFYFTVAVFALLGSVAFAKSDLQLQLGYRRVITDQHNTSDDTADKYESNAFDFSLENFNLFNVKGDFFSVGFAETATGYIGGLDKLNRSGIEFSNSDFKKTFVADFNFVIGPAVGFNFGNFIKLQAMVGFALEYNQYTYEWGEELLGPDLNALETIKNFAVGFATSVQAKFFPKSFISPVVGFRYVYTRTNKFDVNQHIEANYGGIVYTQDGDGTIDGKINNNSFIVYLGVTMNF